RRAAVSSFGISGTNAHVILEEGAQEAFRDGGTTAGAQASGSAYAPWVLSGKEEATLMAQAAKLAAYVAEHSEEPLFDIGLSLATTRSAFEHRAVLVHRSLEEQLAGLQALASGERAAGVIRGTVSPGKLAFLFTGQGSQRLGMGRDLHAAFPAFATAFDTVADSLDKHLTTPLRTVIWDSEDSTLLDRTEYTQPALFAIEVALFRLLESWGVRPDFVAGHSIGELAAAHAAGVLSLEDAAT
ncbi:acyltransferase domain-containing protein, partial [Streptomyces viridiviolaceus]